jgi:hypothetical protein
MLLHFFHSVYAKERSLFTLTKHSESASDLVLYMLRRWPCLVLMALYMLRRWPCLVLMVLCHKPSQLKSAGVESGYLHGDCIKQRKVSLNVTLGKARTPPEVE